MQPPSPFDRDFRLPGAGAAPAGRAPAPAPPETGASNREIYTVGRLNEAVARLLEDSFPLIWVEGELSNLSLPRSGHMYFTLKDAHAQVRCALFRPNRMRLQFAPRDGMQVIARARVGLYGPRGDFQLVVQELEPAGEGALRLAYERLRLRLQEEGLFDSEHKRPLPAFPKRLGVVTSPTGAAIRDVLQVLARRFPSLPVVVYPTRVQGEGAGEEIAAAVERAARRAECDVLLMVRGGGSLEDLWAFNEERVARAIHACPVPVVTGVGHESDVTIADFAADERAPTPSAAAERASPDRLDLIERLAAVAGRARRAAAGGVERRRAALDLHRKRLRHPLRRVEGMAQRTDELSRRAAAAFERGREGRRHRLAAVSHRFARARPDARDLRPGLERLVERARAAAAERRARESARVRELARALHAVSPERTLERGYAIVYREGRVVRDAGEAAVGAAVTARLARGRLTATVTASEPEPPDRDDPAGVRLPPKAEGARRRPGGSGARTRDRPKPSSEPEGSGR